MISIENIYYMLSYAYRNPKIDNLKYSDVESFGGALDLLSFILIKGVSVQLKRGFIKDYIMSEAELSSPKGKIEIAETINKNTHMRKRLVCSFDDYTADVMLNRIIKTTLNYIIKSVSISAQNKKLCRRLNLYLSDVGMVNIKNIRWKEIYFHKQNANYQFLINLCYLIHNNILITQHDGQKKQVTVLDDQAMSRIFEKFVLAYYTKHYPELNARALYIPWHLSQTEKEFLPAMKSDITLEYGGKTLIIDTKYYSKMMQTNWISNKKTIHSSNLYQIYTYVKNMDIKHEGNVSGMLLYAKTDEEIVPNQQYVMDGNTIYVKTLRLDEKFDRIKAQLDAIVTCTGLNGIS